MTDKEYHTTWDTPDNVPEARIKANPNWAAARLATVTEITDTATLGNTDIAEVNLAAPKTITLPAWAAGEQFLVVDVTGGNAITLDADGADTINGAGTYAHPSTQYSATLVFTGSTSGAWFAIDVA